MSLENRKLKTGKPKKESVMHRFDSKIKTILNESGAATGQNVVECLTAISGIAERLAGLYPQNTHPQQASMDYQYYSIVRNKLDKHLLQIDR
jgi:hypothetical protein